MEITTKYIDIMKNIAVLKLIYIDTKLSKTHANIAPITNRNFLFIEYYFPSQII